MLIPLAVSDNNVSTFPGNVNLNEALVTKIFHRLGETKLFRTMLNQDCP